MAEANGQHGSERLDRIEKMIEALVGAQMGLEEEHKKLLTAQILQVDAQTHADRRLAALADSQKHTDGKLAALTDNMNALIQTVDDIIRGGKRPSN